MKISIIGTGMFGFALARHLGDKYQYDNDVKILSYDTNRELIDHLKKYGTHLYHFKNKKLPENISFTYDKKEATKNTDIIVMAVTSQSTREVIKELKYHLKNNIIILNTAKALERQTAKTFSEVIAEEMKTSNIKYNIAKLSGGTFAQDMINDAPLGADIACEDPNVLTKLQNIFRSNTLRIYGNNDLTGVEYAGALKNVIAIFAGIINGLGLPYGSETHMISRAAKEAEELAIKLGAKKHTFSMESQCWGNDLWMSCTGKSRNREYGRLIGIGTTPKDALEQMQEQHKLVEGYYTVESIPQLYKKTGIKTPILNEIYEIVYENKKPKTSIEHLMKRETENIH